MVTIPVRLDGSTEQALRKLSEDSQEDVSDAASRILARAVRSMRARPNWNSDAVRIAAEESAVEDLELAESSMSHRAELLAFEDRA